MASPPFVAVQRTFWRAVRAGASIEEAAGSAGVSATSARRWFGQSGGMPPVSLQEPSSRYLSLEDREAIFQGLAEGWSYRRIGQAIGRPASTVTRELARHRVVGSRPAAEPKGRETPRGGGFLPRRLNYSPSRGCQVLCVSSFVDLVRVILPVEEFGHDVDELEQVDDVVDGRGAGFLRFVGCAGGMPRTKTNRKEGGGCGF